MYYFYNIDRSTNEKYLYDLRLLINVITFPIKLFTTGKVSLQKAKPVF